MSYGTLTARIWFVFSRLHGLSFGSARCHRASVDSPSVNREYAARVLADYRASVERAQALVQTQPFWAAERRAARQAANDMVPYVNVVLRDLMANIVPICGGSVPDHVANLDRLDRTLGTLLRTWKAMAVAGPTGAEVVPPFLPFWAMDPIVGSAASMWEKGKFRQAVGDTAGKLNALTQERLGIHDLSDYDLMAAAFNPKEPTKGRPRLRPRITTRTRTPLRP